MRPCKIGLRTLFSVLFHIDIIFAVLNDKIMALGEKVLDELQDGKPRTTLTSKVQNILQADSDEELREKIDSLTANQMKDVIAAFAKLAKKQELTL